MHRVNQNLLTLRIKLIIFLAFYANTCLATENRISVETNAGTVSVYISPHKARTKQGESLFTRTEAKEVGVDGSAFLSMDDFTPPHFNGRGLASGDIDKDGFIDLLLATEHGLRLYKNDAGVSFEYNLLKFKHIDSHDIFLAALVDLNNDGWLDIFYSAYQKGNYYIINKKGAFNKSHPVKITPSPHVLSKSASFGDINRDGELDIGLGNWFFGYLKRIPPKESNNIILINNGLEFTPHKINSPPGETLSILFSDYIADDNLDLIVGNDFKAPDYYYIGNGTANFRTIKKTDNIIPISTWTTMSVDTADFDNDGDLDIYAAQLAAGVNNARPVPSRAWSTYCDELSAIDDRAKCRMSTDARKLISFGAAFQPSFVTRCNKFIVVQQRKDCTSMMLLLTATRINKKELCEKISPSNMRTRQTCTDYFTPSSDSSIEESANAIDSILNENVLLVSQDGKFTNEAKKFGIETTGWSWNAKFADFDNDEWQDLYVVNGTWTRASGIPTKFFYKNNGGKFFTDITAQSGLNNYMLQSAYTEADFDNDGDLDIFSNSINGPIWHMKNNSMEGNSITIDINDALGNYFGIGTKIIIHYGGENNKIQMRELKSGGGFLSFNAPRMHFGLGGYNHIDEIEIKWTTGEQTLISQKIPANSHIVISRDPNKQQSM